MPQGTQVYENDYFCWYSWLFYAMMWNREAQSPTNIQASRIGSRYSLIAIILACKLTDMCTSTHFRVILLFLVMQCDGNIFSIYAVITHHYCCIAILLGEFSTLSTYWHATSEQIDLEFQYDLVQIPKIHSKISLSLFTSNRRYFNEKINAWAFEESMGKLRLDSVHYLMKPINCTWFNYHDD